MRTTLQYRLTSKIQLGIEYNPLAEEVGPLANIHLLSETLSSPAVIAGTSSDRIGTPDGQSYYLTASKDLQALTKLPLAPYAGVAYGTYEDRLRLIGGLSISLPHAVDSLWIFDGVHLHATLTYAFRRHTFSLILVRAKHPGFSYSVSF